MLAAYRVAATIVVATQTLPEQLEEAARHMPLVLVNRSVEGLEDRCLTIDNVESARLATAHLIALGHRRIAYIAGPASNQDAAARRAGFEQALRENGLTLDPELVVTGNFTEASGQAALGALLERGASFSAVFAGNDQMAYGARLVLFERGLRVPEEVSLVGFDDLPVSTYTIPPLTTVRQPAFDMGVAAAKGVLGLLGGQPLTLPRFKGELIVRGSSGPAPLHPASDTSKSVQEPPHTVPRGQRPHPHKEGI